MEEDAILLLVGAAIDLTHFSLEAWARADVRGLLQRYNFSNVIQ